MIRLIRPFTLALDAIFDGDLRKLFQGSEVAEALKEVDTQELRKSALASAVPPGVRAAGA